MMKKFLCSILGFSILLLFVFVVADYFYSKLLSKKNSANLEIWREVIEGKASADIIVSGDSRVNSDFFPDVIDSITGHSVYDLGEVGHHYNIQRIRLKVFREFNEKPLLLVQTVDNWLFMKEMPVFDREQFLPWMWNRVFRRVAFQSEPLFFLSHSFPLLRYIGHKEKHYSSRETEKGFLIRNRMAPFQSIMNPFPIGFSCDKKNSGRFQDDLRELVDEGIKVIFVIPPMHESLVFAHGEKQKMVDYFKSVAEERKIPFLDYSEMFRSDSTKFNDETHLNLIGARLFSDSLANDILRLGLL